VPQIIAVSIADDRPHLHRGRYHAQDAGLGLDPNTRSSSAAVNRDSCLMLLRIVVANPCSSYSLRHAGNHVSAFADM
jgi:hypothetical protein